MSILDVILPILKVTKNMMIKVETIAKANKNHISHTKAETISKQIQFAFIFESN